MSKKRINKAAKRGGDRGAVLSFEEAQTWLLSRGRFHSSVRRLSKEWHWGTTKVSTFLKRLEDQNILKRTLQGGGLTHFEMIVEMDEFPVFLKNKKQNTSQIGIDIEQVFLGNLQLSEESLQELEKEYERIMLKDGLTDLSEAEIDMMANILEKQLPQRSEIFVRSDTPDLSPQHKRIVKNILGVAERLDFGASRFVAACASVQDMVSRQNRVGR